MGQYDWRDREATRKRPNRRMKFLQPGTRALTVDKHLLAIDTSGSVDNSLLSKFLGVINQLQGDFYIDVMQFDCEKTSDPVPYKRRKANFEFKGRGGTDFGPVFEMCKTRKYKSVIILTDGQAAAPEEPKLTRVLWVLPSKDYQPPVSWGEKVHLSQGG
jgi:predicted metal-dependent peptidase